jgi:hypothetical protein
MGGEMKTVWLIIAKECEDCGGAMAIKAMSTKPSEQDERDTESFLGGMWCIQSHTVRVEIDGEIVSPYDE